MALLEFCKVNYVNNNKVILKDISTKIELGDFISIIGPSGSGKSTFLKLCCHLVSPTSGDLLFNNKNILDYNPTELRKTIGYCFQTPYLFGNTVKDNMAFPFHIRNMEMDMNRVSELFSNFNLEFDIMEKEVKNLSGGEKQRIGLIRTLLFKPEILLLDEATSALDVDNALIVEEIINAYRHSGATVLWITHNPEQSKKYANKLIVIENGEIKALEVLA